MGQVEEQDFITYICIISQIMMINGVFSGFWKMTPLWLTHSPLETPYGDIRRYFQTPIIFSNLQGPQIQVLGFFIE